VTAKRKSKKKSTESGETETQLEQTAVEEAVAEEAVVVEPATEEAAAESSEEQALAEARQEAAKNWDLYLRTQAEMDNFRKRMQRQQQERIASAKGEVFLEILPVIDNLERAVEHARESEGDAAGLQEGIEMTLEQFGKALERFGIKSVAAVGQPFDTACHEAMSQVETEEHPPNSVVQQFQKGYWLGERLLRPAMVVVAKAPAEPVVEDRTESDEQEPAAD